MDLSTVDFSTWPPAAVWCVVVIWVLCGPLPDALGLRDVDQDAPTS